jgi:hypothetical protein
MEPRGGARHRWENRQVEWAGAMSQSRNAESRKGISEIEGKNREGSSERAREPNKFQTHGPIS